MSSYQLRQFFQIFVSFFVAWLLMILPMPFDWQWLRPDWLTLVLIYWIFTLPQSVGILTAWCAGLVMDILSGGILGQQALSMVVVAFFARTLRYRLRLFPFWQQALGILLLVGLKDLVLLLVQWLIGHPPRTLLYWASTVSSVLLWPYVYRLLQVYERKVLV